MRSKKNKNKNANDILKLAGYLIVENNPSPAPSSQSIRLEMADAGVLDPRMHLFFARTRDIANLVLINDIVRLFWLKYRTILDSFHPLLLFIL